MILKMGKPEIYVHNTSLPMDAKRRWLRRGEQVKAACLCQASRCGAVCMDSSAQRAFTLTRVGVVAHTQVEFTVGAGSDGPQVSERAACLPALCI
jgi:hypothetical protein